MPVLGDLVRIDGLPRLKNGADDDRHRYRLVRLTDRTARYVTLYFAGP